MASETPFAPFFVYGTLLPGQPNEHLWRGKVEGVLDAWLPAARLYDMGNFPMAMLTPEEQESRVRGKLLIPTHASYEELLSSLDDLEGYQPDNVRNSIFRRLKRRVQLAATDQSKGREAWVYVGQPRYVGNIPPLAVAYWPAHAAQKAGNIAAWWANFESLFPDNKGE